MTEAVFYNVWRTKTPDDRAQLLAGMREEAPALAAKPGFVSLLVSECPDDGRVLAEGRWGSRDAFEAAVSDSADAQAGRQALESFGTPEPGLFTEVFRVPPQPSPAAATYPDDPAFWHTFKREIVDAGGVRLQVVSGGAGEPMLLIPGFLETWGVWHRIMPLLADRYRLIAPDLRGLGGSEGPKTGYDKRTLAQDMAALADALSLDRFHVVGHDFGGQVAYRLAAARRAQVATLTAIEAILPGIEVKSRGDEGRFWIFPFHMAPKVPEMLTSGHEREYVAALWDIFVQPGSEATPADRAEVERAFAQPGALAAGFEMYRSMPADIADFSEQYRDKLVMPALALGGEHCMESRVVEAFRQVATNVTGGLVEGASHFTPLERSAATADRIGEFLATHPIGA